MPFLPAGDDEGDHDVDVVALHRVAAATPVLVQRTRRAERLPVAVACTSMRMPWLQTKIHKEAAAEK